MEDHTVSINGNSENIQIQQDSNGSSQSISQHDDFDYEKVLKALHQIQSYFTLPQFTANFGSKSEDVKAVVNQTLELVEQRKPKSKIKICLNSLKEIAKSVGVGVISSGILSLLGTVI